MKENQSVKPIINMEAGIVTFEVKGHPAIVLHLDKVHPDNIRRAGFVGMAQTRIVDAAAIGRTDDKGNIIPEADRIATKHARMLKLVEHYESGSPEWNVKGEGGFAPSGLIIALCAMQPKRDPAEIREFVKGLSAAEKKALQESEVVKAHLPKVAEEAVVAVTSKLEEFLTA